MPQQTPAVKEMSDGVDDTRPMRWAMGWERYLRDDEQRIEHSRAVEHDC